MGDRRDLGFYFLFLFFYVCLIGRWKSGEMKNSFVRRIMRIENVICINLLTCPNYIKKILYLKEFFFLLILIKNKTPKRKS